MEKIICDRCGCIITDHQEAVTVEGGDNLCRDCADTHTVVCDCCGDRIYVSDAVHDDYIALCESCYDDHYHRCASCHRLVHDDEVSWHSEEDYCYIAIKCKYVNYFFTYVLNLFYISLII